MKLGVSLLLVWLTAQATAWAQPAYPRQTYPQGPSVQITVTPPPVYYVPPAYGYTPPRRAEPQWQRPPGWYDDETTLTATELANQSHPADPDSHTA